MKSLLRISAGMVEGSTPPISGARYPAAVERLLRTKR